MQEARKVKPLVKPLDPAKIQLASFAAQMWQIDLRTHRCIDGSPATLAHVFTPACWVKMVDKMKVGDLIRVCGVDFDFDVSVVWVGGGGLKVRHHPHMPKFVHDAFLQAQKEEIGTQAALNQKMLGGVQ